MLRRTAGVRERKLVCVRGGKKPAALLAASRRCPLAPGAASNHARGPPHSDRIHWRAIPLPPR
ncbi:hypothetical protein XMIN_3543 [Xanthomonas citri pv. mangiferaeindicae LMG 941]|nr:hypothetical protein XMIN_3543 [Xanthomonas citri pv. mangiferaeindicae LMG 941]